MSRFFLPDDRGCFCCERLAPSGVYPMNMLNQQHQRCDAPASSNSSNPFLMSAHATPNNGEDQSQGMHEENCDNQFSHNADSQVNWNCHNSPAGEMMFKSQNWMFMPAGGSATETMTDKDCIWNFRRLQNRELGCKFSGQVASAALGCDDDSVCDNVFVTGASKVLHTDSMDLDSALDELGMLSTVTNSRKEYLQETQSQGSIIKHEQRLRCKSKSSPNLTALSQPNGYRIVQMNTRYVTSVNDTKPSASQASTNKNNKYKPEFSHLEYRNASVLQEASGRYKSGPQMSRIHKDRYIYRRSRYPYTIPNRLCTSLQESDFGADYFNSCISSLETPFSSLSMSSLEPGLGLLSDKLTTCPQSSESKSNTTSPLKPHAELRLTRSLSAEALTACRSLDLDEKNRDPSRSEQSLDVVTSQMTSLHMS